MRCAALGGRLRGESPQWIANILLGTAAALLGRFRGFSTRVGFRARGLSDSVSAIDSSNETPRLPRKGVETIEGNTDVWDGSKIETF